MSEEYRSFDQEQGEYEDEKQREWEEWKAFKNQKLRDQGIIIPEDPSLAGIHPDTIKSYRELGLQIEDRVDRTVARPNYRLKSRMEEVKGKPIESHTLVRNVYRLMDEAGAEKMIYSTTEYFLDFNNNAKSIDCRNIGVHEEVYGDKTRDSNYKVIGAELKGRKNVFTEPWSKEKFLPLMELHKKSVKILKEENWQIKESFIEPQLIIAYAKNKGEPYHVDLDKRPFTIKNEQDFIKGTFKELTELARRGLSTLEPSLPKLKNPVSDDPPNSIEKRQRGYISPGAISYNQGSYR